MATNPTLEEHKESVKKMFLKEMEKNRLINKLNGISEVKSNIESAIADRFVDQMVSRSNYYIFSTAKYSIENKSELIGLGILGNVFVKDYDQIKAAMGENESSNDNSIDVKINDKSVSLFEKGINLFYTQKDYDQAEITLNESIIFCKFR